MSRFGIVAKRIKRKKDLPDRAKIYCINHIYLSGKKFKIYVNGGNQFIARSQLFLFNEYDERWYKIEYKDFENNEEGYL
jgi:hypothetical protein